MTVTVSDFQFDSVNELRDLGGPATRFQHNVSAIKLLKSLEAASRSPGDLTTEEQQTLVRYSGWGDSEVLNRAFPRGAYSWAPICPELGRTVADEEREGIISSALNAHFTTLPIIRAIYDALDYLGIGNLPSLRVLEPAAGVGHFFGAMPASIACNSERVAVELDSITARILAYLYPSAKVFGQAYEETPLPRDYFDLIISNIPFGSFPVHDPQIKHRYLKAAIHDYYFVRSLKLLKPGGIIAFITSRYTLDKVNARVRQHIAQHAELLAAARLPESAFHKNAGTEVVTDVLILRKKASQTGPDEKPDWIETEELAIDSDRPIPINRLYTKRPELMLGAPICTRGMYRECEFTLKSDGRDPADALQEALKSQITPGTITPLSINHVQTSIGVPSAANQESAVNLSHLSEGSRRRASALLDIYTAAKQVINLQLIDAADEAVADEQRERGQPIINLLRDTATSTPNRT
jgi:hypothetical protein